MKLSKTLSIRSGSIIVLAGALLYLTVAYLVLKTPSATGSTPPAPVHVAIQKKINYGLPVRLKIPSISVDAAVNSVGLTTKGEMDAPKGPADAGWYNLGPRPGEIGSSVIDGHFGWVGGTPAAFDNLSKLQKGDELFIEDENGVTTIFVVAELGTYGQNQDATSVFRSVDGKSHLNLITCEGIWNEAQQSYSNRLVVFSNKKI